MTQEEFFNQFKTHDTGRGFRANIKCLGGKIELSIIAGEYSYSTPRTDLERVNGYEAFEVGIFNKRNKWASYDLLQKNGVFELLGYGEYDNSKAKDKKRSNANVFGWVPLDRILQLINK